MGFVGKERTIFTRLNRLLLVVLLLSILGAVLGVTLGHKSRSSAKSVGPANPNEVVMQAVRQGNTYSAPVPTMSESQTRDQTVIRIKSLSPLQQCGVEDVQNSYNSEKLEKLMDAMLENAEIRNKMKMKLKALSLRG